VNSRAELLLDTKESNLPPETRRAIKRLAAREVLTDEDVEAVDLSVDLATVREATLGFQFAGSNRFLFSTPISNINQRFRVFLNEAN
jgi:hypothetical protein